MIRITAQRQAGPLFHCSHSHSSLNTYLAPILSQLSDAVFRLRGDAKHNEIMQDTQRTCAAEYNTVHVCMSLSVRSCVACVR
ncbi:hypothetical protein E2C01_097644 [Portunus trituberculatus]|uniref:Uncharacterized protein n=1 Tax=Portunus trituberculatus TaxID=210409 RepID=A0A5B7K5D7_PORTR|nr:hypothetical protein [Portunus trituberculatus]